MRHQAAIAALISFASLGVATVEVHGESAPHQQSADPRVQLTSAFFDRLGERLDAASEARLPPLVPPRPVAVRWRARRIRSIDLGGALLALGTADLDGDGRAEILALTTDELVVIAWRGGRRLSVLTRTTLPVPPAALRPRDPVGSLVVSDHDQDGRVEVAVRSSAYAAPVTFRYRDRGLVAVGKPPALRGFPLCPGVAGELEPGRNYFVRVTPVAPAPDVAPGGQPAARPLLAFVDSADASGQPERSIVVPERFYGLRCARNLLDPAGRPLAAAAAVAADGTLSVWTRRACRRRDQECRQDPGATGSVPELGVAFEIADIDRDGHPDLAISAATPPGEPDRVTVYSFRGDRFVELFHRPFTSGVAGVTVGDVDGDGAVEVLAAVRIRGDHRIDLWKLN